MTPDIGEPIPGDTTGPQLRPYADELEAVRVLYFVTALRTVVVVAYTRAGRRDRPAGATSAASTCSRT
ncbi:hypothetical protein ACGFYY_32840 [Streptomyces sp. NPDC048331]|uniref:hypothetical protein n=1 Tax=Streptomyces sp. NPDC048331 TaxID=3365534 RepID=UPI0037225ECE